MAFLGRAFPERRALILPLVGIALQLVPFAARATPSVPLEYAVKASYLYKFAPFVQWPPRAFATADSPLHLCLVGTDPFGSVLDDVVAGQQAQGHPIVIIRMASIDAEAQCHILYIGRSTAQSEIAALRAVAGKPVLTVTDGGDDAQGGMIQFVLHKGRVRFIVNTTAATASGIQISSKLLELALKVER